MHIIAAKAVCFGEALKPEFRAYQQRIVNNAQALARGLMDEGFNLVSGGTDNHLMLVDLRSKGITGRIAEKNLDMIRITVNKNVIPDDPESPFVTSGIRIGTPAVTTRGMGESEMYEIAKAISLALSDFDANKEEVISIVDSLCSRFPLYNDGVLR
jgi:glycine hydroxymethyltransferase